MKKNVLILGLGVSGKGCASFLLQEGYRVTGADQRVESLQRDPQIQPLLARGMEIVSDEGNFPSFDQLIVSPGISSSHPLAQEAKKRGVEVIGEVELALRHIRNRCVAITGSNGKTTTVMLLTHLLQRGGKKARPLGNIGAPLTEYLLNPDPEEILVIELSSFQLETVSAPVFEAAALLNLTPNHLNWHPSMEAYAKAKARIGKCLRPDGKLFISKQVARDFGYLFDKYDLFDEELVASNSDVSYIKSGLPQQESIQAAFAFCRLLGVPLDQCVQNVASFRKPPHRIEWVADVEGVSYFNDSKASNIHAVLHAVSLFEGPLILIAGGVHKGSSYVPWIVPFQGKVKAIVAFGEASGQMEAELSSTFPFFRVAHLEEAVKCARENQKSASIVLLSPGCSSYDQFQSFEHRGDEFKRFVRGLK